MPQDWLEIGLVVSVDAAKRVLRVKSVPRCGARFEGCRRVWLQANAQTPVPVRVARTRELGAVWMVELTPGISRDVVADFRKARVLVMAEPLGAGTEEFVPCLADLTGMSVVMPGEERLGEVFEVMDTPAGGVLRIALPDSRTAALPFTEAVIASIDGASGVIHVVDPTPYLVMDDAAPDA